MTPAKALADRLTELHPDDDHECCFHAPTLAQAALDWFREQRPTREEIAKADYESLHKAHHGHTWAQQKSKAVREVYLARADRLLALWDAKEREG